MSALTPEALQKPSSAARRPFSKAANEKEDCCLINCSLNRFECDWQAGLLRFTQPLKDHFGFRVHNDASSTASSLQLAFVLLNSLGWMENDNPLIVPLKPTGSRNCMKTRMVLGSVACRGSCWLNESERNDAVCEAKIFVHPFNTPCLPSPPPPLCLLGHFWFYLRFSSSLWSCSLCCPAATAPTNL